jgi:hypothetical protein
MPGNLSFFFSGIERRTDWEFEALVFGASREKEIESWDEVMGMAKTWSLYWNENSNVKLREAEMMEAEWRRCGDSIALYLSV